MSEITHLFVGSMQVARDGIRFLLISSLWSKPL